LKNATAILIKEQTLDTIIHNDPFGESYEGVRSIVSTKTVEKDPLPIRTQPSFSI